jgi:acetyl/propionyl-CoA carboxylase alpha subunit
VQQGDTVTPHYDAWLAKVIAWGVDREQAIARLDRALAEFRVAGVSTSIPFHRRVLADAHFRAGHYDTSFVDERLDGGKVAETVDDTSLRAAVALLALSRAEEVGDPTVSIEHKIKGGSRFVVTIAHAGAAGAPRVVIDGDPFEIDAVAVDGAAWSVIIAGRQAEASIVSKRATRFEVRVGETTHALEISAAD